MVLVHVQHLVVHQVEAEAEAEAEVEAEAVVRAVLNVQTEMPLGPMIVLVGVVQQLARYQTD